jgi:hypothetical protein
MGTGPAAAKPKPKSKAKPKKRPPPPAPAPAAATRGTGASQDFQFVEVQWVDLYILDKQLMLSLGTPKKLTKILSKWIYAFQIQSGTKAKLAKEYYADPKGALSFVDGPARRGVELTAAPKPVPVDAASLPLSINGAPVKYAFVVMRDRVGKGTIAAMENGMHEVYEHKYLGADGRFLLQDAAKTNFVPVVDMITLAERLHLAYTDALDTALNFAIVHPKHPAPNVARYQARKYQLARMIRDTLLTVKKQPADPLDLKSHMLSQGETLKNDIETHERTVRDLNRARVSRANQLSLLFRSTAWTDLHDWYLGDPVTAQHAGHIWQEGMWQHIERLGETAPGREFLKLLVQMEQNPNTPPNRRWLGYLVAPDPEADDSAWDFFRKWFPIARKATTAFALGLSEMAPALALFMELGRAKRRVVGTLEFLFESTAITIETLYGPSGLVSQSLKISHTRIRIEIPITGAKLDLEPWIEGGKVKWPDGTHEKTAKTGEVLCKLLMGIEVLNFLFGVGDMLDAIYAQQGAKHPNKAAAIAEALAGAIDLTVALEEPILGWAHRRAHQIAEAAHAAEVAKAAAAAEAAKKSGQVVEAAAESATRATGAELTEAFTAAKSEATSVFGKITGPAIFKGLGAASAAVDTVVNFIEAREAFSRGETGVAVGKSLLSFGSALGLVASVLNAAGYVVTASAMATEASIATGAALTAAAASFLVAGVVVVVIGFVVVNLLTTTPWQQFIEHTPWGTPEPVAGIQTWSGGNFAEWTDTADGMQKMIQVLTAMLCSYTIHAADNAHAITASFGGLPPRSSLDVTFDIVYKNGQTKHMQYVIDVDTRAIRRFSGDGPHFPGRIHPFYQGDRLCGLEVEAQRLVDAPVKDSRATVIVRYGAKSRSAEVVTGTIPIKDPMVYWIRDDGSMRTDVMDSMKVGQDDLEEAEAEEKREKKKEAEEAKRRKEWGLPDEDEDESEGEESAPAGEKANE